jgi:hypothetical protein
LATDAGDERRCCHLPAQLARAGYVVAVADLSRFDGSGPTEATRQLADVAEWMRVGWPDRRVLAAALTGVVGHAGGAWPAARLAAEGGSASPTVTARMWRMVTRALGRPPTPIRAYASLGGEWSDERLLGDIAAAKLFVRSSAEPDIAVFWDGLTPPKHAAVLDGLSHEDYLSDDAEDLEHLGHDEMIATKPSFSTVVADLVTMFFAKHLPPPAARTLPRHISNHLVPPPLRLNAEQRFYAKEYHLAGITRLTRAGGRVLLSHVTRKSTATVSLPTIAP